LKLLQATPPTASTRRGNLVLDDTSCKKAKTTKATEGAKLQHCSSTGDLQVCNVLVQTAWCSHDPGHTSLPKRIPINFLPYKPASEFTLGKHDPDFKDKHQLACCLIQEALDLKVLFSHIVFDSWYLNKKVVSFIESKNLTWISEAPSNLYLSYRGKWVRTDELVKLIPEHSFLTPVNLTIKGKEQTVWCLRLSTKVRALDNRKVTVIVVKGTLHEEDDQEFHAIITNAHHLHTKEIVLRYRSRWHIEELFKDLKEFTYLDHYQVRSLKAIKHHWYLSTLAYSFLFWVRQNAYLSKQVDKPPSTIGETLSIIRSLNSISSLEWCADNIEQAP
jgi:SRSO17 transposase